MKVEALVNFCGALSMAKGEIREYSDAAVVADLIAAGYVKEIQAAPTQKKSGSKKEARKIEGQQD